MAIHVHVPGEGSGTPNSDSGTTYDAGRPYETWLPVTVRHGRQARSSTSLLVHYNHDYGIC